jgi:predicted amidohydrolase
MAFGRGQALCAVFVWLTALAATVLPAIGSCASADAREVKVAMCQMFCLDGDRAGNYVRIENALIEAKAKGADIICFPETALLGWVNPEAHKRAHPIPGEDSDRLCELAKKHQVYLCIGLAEKDGEKLHDTVLLIDDQGKILLKHRKINILTKLMDPPYTPGTEVNTVETKFGKIGLLICADTFSDEILGRMGALKPDLLLVPYGIAAPEEKWPAPGKSLESIVCKAARVTGAATVGTDVVGEISHGPWTGWVYGGFSIAADADGKTLAVAKDRDRDVVVVRIKRQDS